MKETKSKQFKIGKLNAIEKNQMEAILLCSSWVRKNIEPIIQLYGKKLFDYPLNFTEHLDKVESSLNAITKLHSKAEIENPSFESGVLSAKQVDILLRIDHSLQCLLLALEDAVWLIDTGQIDISSETTSILRDAIYDVTNMIEAWKMIDREHNHNCEKAGLCKPQLRLRGI